MIVITAPTSKIGRQLLDLLVDQPEPVRIVARDPTRIAPRVRERVDVVVGSHRDQDVVAQAFAGARAVFWLVPADPRSASADAAYVDFSRPAFDALRHFGVKQVVGISSVGRGWPSDAGNITSTLKVDDAIAETGVSYRALTCATFMDNVLRQVSGIKERGILTGTAPGDLKMAMCATRDIASAAASLLLDPTWTGLGACPILGPEDLSFNDVATIMSDVLGASIRYQQLPFDALRNGLLERGASVGMAEAVVRMAIAQSEGIDRMDRRSALGTTPTTFREFCVEVLRPALSS